MIQYDIEDGVRARLSEIAEEDKSLLDDLADWATQHRLVDGDVGFQLGERAVDAMLAPIRWRRAIGEVWDTTRVIELSGVSRQAINKWVKGQSVLAIHDVRRTLFPAWQFDHATGRPYAVVKRFLEAWRCAEPEVPPMTIAAWAIAPSEWLDGVVPASLVADDPERFEQAAEIEIGQRTR